MVESETSTKRNGKDNSKLIKAACTRLRDLMSRAELDDIVNRHAVGIVVQEVRDGAKYGSGAVGKIAHELGVDESTLSRYAKVADAWTKPEIVALAKMKNAHGLPLTWSHLVEIADVKDGRRRRGLVGKVIEEGLSVRGLRALIGANEETSVEKPVKRAPVLRMPIVERGDALASEIGGLVETVENSWGHDIMQTLSKRDKEIPNEVLGHLEQDCDAIANAGARLQVLATQIRNTLAERKIKNSPAPPSTSVTGARDAGSTPSPASAALAVWSPQGSAP